MIKKHLKTCLGKWGLLSPLQTLKCYFSDAVFRTIEKDYRNFQKNFAAILRPSSDNASDAPVVLIIGLHNFVPSAKMEGFFGKALQNKGYRPQVLLKRAQRQMEKYYRIFGFDDFIFFDDFFSEDYDDTIQREIELFFDKVIDARELMKFQYLGAEIGKHALSWLVRQVHAGQIDLANPTLIRNLKTISFEGMRTVHATQKLLASITPKIVLFNERGYTPYGELFDICLLRGLNTIQYVGSHANESFHFKRYTLDTRLAHPISFHPATWECIKKIPLTPKHQRKFIERHYRRYQEKDWYARQELQKGKHIYSKEHVRQMLSLDAGKKTAVIFSQVLWDATFFYGEGLFQDYGTWLVESIKAACANPRLNWIVKLHPSNVWRLKRDSHQGEMAEHILLREQVGKLPEHIKLVEADTSINTVSLFSCIDYCLTVRGTIGMEAPMFGIPVVTAGTGRYSELGFTINSQTIEEYLATLAHLEDIPSLSEEQVALAIKHAHAIFELRPLEFTTFIASYSDSVPGFLQPKIQLNAATSDDIRKAKDLDAFANWAQDTKKMDFLNMSDFWMGSEQYVWNCRCNQNRRF